VSFIFLDESGDLGFNPQKQSSKYLSATDSSIMAICLNKSRVHTKLQDEKHVLYNYVTNILLDRILSKKLISGNEKILLIVSKRETNRFLNDNFTFYLKNQAKLNHNILIDVAIKTPAEEKALQVVDFVSWSLFKKYESQNTEYYGIFKKLVVEENMLFPLK